MRRSDVQALLAQAGLYGGGIDGIDGPKTRAGVKAALDGIGGDWSAKRREIGAGQTILNRLGFEAGSVDGYAGHNTNEALAAWKYDRAHGKREEVDRTPKGYGGGASSIPHQRDVGTYYGQPGDQIKSRLVRVELPFKLRIDFNLRQSTSRITVHERCAQQLENALISVQKEYGMERMNALGIDRYAGAYNHRKMRGGSKWSMHAYGCAIDFYAVPNGLRMQCPQALFCKPEYKAFLDIMEDHGWLPAIRLWGKDAMHFQMARL